MLPQNLFQFLNIGQPSPNLGPMEPSMPSYADDPNVLFPINTTQRDADREALLRILGQTPQMQGPVSPVNMAFRTPDAVAAGVAALAALLGGKKGAQFGAGLTEGWLKGKQGKAQQDTQFAMQEADFKNRQAEADFNSKFNVAKARLGFSEQDVQEAEKNRDQEIARQDKKEYQDKVAIAKKIQGLETQFRLTKNLPGKKKIAEALRKLQVEAGEPVTVPDDAGIEQIWLQESGMERKRIYDLWDDDLRRAMKDNYGMVLPAEAARLAKLKTQYESQLAAYGLDNPYLPDPPTEQSKVAASKAALEGMARERLNSQLDKNAQSILESKARIGFRREQLGIAKQNAGTAAKNAETSRLRYKLSKEVKEHNGATQKTINGLEAEIRAIRHKQSKEPSTMKRGELSVKAEALREKVNYWKEQMEPEVEATKPNPLDPQQAAAAAAEVRRKLANGEYTEEEAAQAFREINEAGSQPGVDWKDLSKKAIYAIRVGKKDPAAVKAEYERLTGRKANF